jgi:hypothetical protein
MNYMIKKSETRPCGKAAWKSRFVRGALTIGAVVSLLSVTASARASCGSLPQVVAGKLAHPASWDVQSGRAYLTLVEEPMASMVGMWHVTFTAKGNGSAIPDGAPVDNAIAVWHSDKTEIMNSGRPAQDGDFCLGVWEEVGKCQFKVSHWAWMGNDTTNPGGVGKPTGPTHISEEVTLSEDGKKFSGSFTLDAYDTSYNLTTHITGTLQGTRITLGTTVEELM